MHSICISNQFRETTVKSARLAVFANECGNCAVVYVDF